ncbi:hypothetical protein GCM10025857_06800 [Alicyclobacillus contaminans]|uniref:hypothetical protein n=1 Tax=Alicyclobacillus contaminans TaxID=392016 RepID=UPI0012EB7717|nr:hypothetical protein [Alicyclobacillus contaminans]GMA49323.1 hypothetical protein GCM10025857_06800 [Alicyclobacillus contaminans]
MDQLTYTPAGGWAYTDQVTITRIAKVSHDGSILLSVDHTPVQQVYSLTYQTDPFDAAWSVPANQIWWDDGSYIIRAYLGGMAPLVRFQRVRVTVEYAGGYPDDEMPADIRRSTSILAARLWKEKDSGYSDVIGSTDFGILQYTKAAPKDVLAMLQQRRRVGV